MQTNTRKILEGIGPDGKKRKYTFKLVDVVTGLRLYHEYDFTSAVMVAIDALQQIKEGEEESEVYFKLIAFAKAFKGIWDWKALQDISKCLLAEAVVASESNEWTIGADGFCQWTQGAQLEQYLVLFYALCANYPKDFDFLGLALVEDDTPSENEGQGEDGGDESLK